MSITLTNFNQVQTGYQVMNPDPSAYSTDIRPDNPFDVPGTELELLDLTYGKLRYVWVKNLGTALADGELVYWATDSAYRLAVTHAIGTSAAQGPRTQLAGVAVSAIPQNSYGWIQIYGYHSGVKVVTDTYINGMELQASATAATAEKAGAAGTAATYPIVGRALGAQSGSDPYYVATFIDIGRF